MTALDLLTVRKTAAAASYNYTCLINDETQHLFCVCQVGTVPYVSTKEKPDEWSKWKGL